jgi:hypothetical protein
VGVEEEHVLSRFWRLWAVRVWLPDAYRAGRVKLHAARSVGRSGR